MDTLIVARVRRPHGVRGAVLVAVETDRPEHVFKPGRKLGLADRKGSRVLRELTLSSFRPRPDGAMLSFEEIGDRDVAAELRQHTLVIDAADAAPVGEDEVHYADLVGLAVTADERPLGKLTEVREIASREFLVIREQGREELLVPLVPEFIEKVDVEQGELRLRLPEGFLEI